MRRAERCRCAPPRPACSVRDAIGLRRHRDIDEMRVGADQQQQPAATAAHAATVRVLSTAAMWRRRSWPCFRDRRDRGEDLALDGDRRPSQVGMCPCRPPQTVVVDRLPRRRHRSSDGRSGPARRHRSCPCRPRRGRTRSWRRRPPCRPRSLLGRGASAPDSDSAHRRRRSSIFVARQDAVAAEGQHLRDAGVGMGRVDADADGLGDRLGIAAPQPGRRRQVGKPGPPLASRPWQAAQLSPNSAWPVSRTICHQLRIALGCSAIAPSLRSGRSSARALGRRLLHLLRRRRRAGRCRAGPWCRSSPSGQAGIRSQ